MYTQSAMSRKLQNGITFDEIKAMHNAILNDDAKTLGDKLQNYKNINHQIEYYITGRLVDWSLPIRAMMDSTSCTLLHLAAECGSFDCAELLISKGANVNEYSLNARRQKEHTPLQTACMGSSRQNACLKNPQHLEVIRFLLAEGADMHLRMNSDRQKPSTYEWIVGKNQCEQVPNASTLKPIFEEHIAKSKQKRLVLD